MTAARNSKIECLSAFLLTARTFSDVITEPRCRVQHKKSSPPRGSSCPHFQDSYPPEDEDGDASNGRTEVTFSTKNERDGQEAAREL